MIGRGVYYRGVYYRGVYYRGVYNRGRILQGLSLKGIVFYREFLFEGCLLYEVSIIWVFIIRVDKVIRVIIGGVY